MEKVMEDAKDSFTTATVDDRARNRGERGAIQEKSWILSAQAKRVDDLRTKRLLIEKVDPEEHEIIGPGSLVILGEDGEDGQKQRAYFVHSDLGGTELEIDGIIIMVISPISPVGRALDGKRAGDEVELQLPGGERCLSIVEVK